MKLPRISTLVLHAVLPAVLVVLMSYPADLMAQSASEEHLVSPQSLQQQLQSSTSARQKNIQSLTRFMSSPTAEKAMRDAKIDPVQVQKTIPTLSDQELAKLSLRATDAQQKFSAGALTNDMLVLIIVLIAVIIIVAIVH